MKIHIIGASGSGKTYLASKLSSKYSIAHYDLDELFWNNSSSYGTKRQAEERDKLLSDILEGNEWIIEGVYYDWLDESFRSADVIYIMDIKPSVCKRRIIKRFIKRKLRKEPGKKETLKSLFALLKWTDKYFRENLVTIKEHLKRYDVKTVYIKSAKEVNSLF